MPARKRSVTRRRKPASRKKATKKPCKRGQTRNRSTGRCRKRATQKKTKKTPKKKATKNKKPARRRSRSRSRRPYSYSPGRRNVFQRRVRAGGSPSDSAYLYGTGQRVRGSDGRLYRIIAYQKQNGTWMKRWSPVGQGR